MEDDLQQQRTADVTDDENFTEISSGTSLMVWTIDYMQYMYMWAVCIFLMREDKYEQLLINIYPYVSDKRTAR